MMLIDSEQIARAIDGRFVRGSIAFVSGVSIDSRTTAAGDAFFAIRGDRFDGHDFVQSAIEKGALCVVVEHDRELSIDERCAVIMVEDTIAALAKLAGWYRQQLSVSVIAITGSAGKTSTRQMLHAVLSRFYRCHQAPKSFNNLIGVSLTILSAEADDEILLLELGSNHPGEIAVLSDLAKPDIAVVTFIGPAHLEGFGTLEHVLQEKLSIVNGLRIEGTLYINGDQAALADKAHEVFGGRIITFGTRENCDVIGTDLQLCGHKGSLTIDGCRINVPLAGKASLMNALTVWSVCRDLKVGLSDFSEIIGQLQPVSMRMEILESSDLTILNDCYNANPASMANALEALAGFGTDGQRRLVFIAGAMMELGEQAPTLHQELGKRAAEAGVRLLLCVGPYAQDIATGASRQGNEIEVVTFENTDLLCNILHKYLQGDDIVLVKGSRAAGLEKAVDVLLQL